MWKLVLSVGKMIIPFGKNMRSSFPAPNHAHLYGLTRDDLAALKETKEVLVALLPKTSAIDILKTEGWYHSPVDPAPKRWPPKVMRDPHPVLPPFKSMNGGRGMSCMHE